MLHIHTLYSFITLGELLQVMQIVLGSEFSAVFFTVAAVQFDPVQYRVREHDGNAVLQLVSSRTCQFDYNVTVDVSNGTATG